jgi:predicted ester cyclase
LTDDLTELCRRLVVGELAAVNRQDPHGLADHFAETCEFVDLSDGTRIRGNSAFRADLVELFTAVPDFHVVSSRVIAEHGAVAAEIQLSGTPVSEWRGHAPTGRSFIWDTCSFYDVDPDSELLLRERMYYDAAALEAQLAPQPRL